MDSHLGWQHRRLGDWQALSVQTCPLVFRACAGGRQSLNGSPSWIQNVHFGPKSAVWIQNAGSLCLSLG